MSPELEQVTFRRRDERVWEMVSMGGEVIAWAEVFPGDIQWGVRLADQAPSIEDTDLVKLVGKMLTWELSCPADTVDVVLGRTHDHHTLVKVGGEYV